MCLLAVDVDAWTQRACLEWVWLIGEDVGS